MNQKRRKSGLLWVGALLFLVSTGLLSSGCASVTQSEECKAYVACLTARDSKLNIQTDFKRFETGGSCWGSPDGADLCTRACKNGSVWLKNNYQDLPSACK